MIGRYKTSLFLLITLKFLLILMHDPNLAITLRREIYGFVALIILPATLDEVTLYQIQETVIFWLVHPRVLYDDQSVCAKGIRYLMTVTLPTGALS